MNNTGKKGNLILSTNSIPTILVSIDNNEDMVDLVAHNFPGKWGPYRHPTPNILV